MSARSPLGSLSGASSADVAEDFGESLKDLQANNKYEISNLTIIAKENTEHAQAISQVLEKHIKTIAPTKRLVALYVLDSIVKNVGTPYNVYLSANLFNTFMGAYTQVDQNTRRNMEAMVKTWKEPVPGSMDPRPVFPHEVVQPIENALIKAKTLALQNGRPGQMQPPGGYRSTPTPPQYDNRYAPPPSAAPPQPQSWQNYPPHPTQPYPQPTPSPFPPTPQQYQPQPYQPPPQQPVHDVEAIKRDVSALIAERQAQFSRNWQNPDLKTQLEALLQLSTILHTQSLDANSLAAVQRQISGLAAQAPATPKPAAPPSLPPTPQWPPPASVQPPQYPNNKPSLPYHQAPPVQSHLQPPPPTIPQNALNSLQALLSNGQKPSTPQMRAAAPVLQHASHQQLSNFQNQAAATPTLNGGDLLASLSKSGLLPQPPSVQPTPPAPTPQAAPAPPAPSAADLLKSLSTLIPPASQTGTPNPPPAQLATTTTKPRIPMTSAALKTFRPELVHALYDAHPNQCNTCGRRFAADPTGRTRKERHLDWHFRTKQRMADPNTNRGQHRNWYVDEMEWITLSEFDPSTTSAAEMSAQTAKKAGASSSAAAAAEKFVRAPPGATKATCSICFEEMKTSYSEELQDWVFQGATTYGGKIVHAQCLAEMVKGQQGGGGSLGVALGVQGRQRSATPDSALGKRKAEGALSGAGASKMRVQ